MGLFTRDLKTLEDLFLHTLKDVYYAENQIVKNLPQMIEAATDSELKKGLKQHLVETENQVVRLEQAFELLGDVDGRTVTNAAVIASAQAVEHYEITRYGTLIAWAQELGKDEVIPLFERNLREEKAADKKLTAIAEARVNKGTARASSDKRSSTRAGARRKVAKTATKPRKRPGAPRRRAS